MGVGGLVYTGKTSVQLHMLSENNIPSVNTATFAHSTMAPPNKLKLPRQLVDQLGGEGMSGLLLPICVKS